MTYQEIKRNEEINTLIQDDSLIETNLSFQRKQNDSKIKEYKADKREMKK